MPSDQHELLPAKTVGRGMVSKVLYFVATVQWGILAPLNLIKVLLNVVSPTAHLWVAKESETCQGQCGIARMWATLFWSGQIAFSLGYLYIFLALWRGEHSVAKAPFVHIGVLQKLAVGTLLLKAYFDGIVKLPIACAAGFDLFMAALLVADSIGGVQRHSVGTRTARPTKRTIEGFLLGLRAYAACWWFPLVVGFLQGLNMFTLVLTGPILVLYFSAVLANPGRRLYIALVNAAGTTLGVAILVFVIQRNGTDWVKLSFPSVFLGGVWEMTEAAFQKYGAIGGFLISCLPVVLHPLIFIALLAGMNVVTLVGTIFAGRVVKYVVMAQLAATMPHLLRKLGSSFQRALDTAQQKQD